MLNPKSEPPPDMDKFIFSLHILIGITAVALYYTMGLMWSTAASLAAITTLVVGLKLAGQRVEPFLYFELLCGLAFGLPGIFMQNGLLMKLDGPISDLGGGLMYGIAALLMKKSVFLTVMPDILKKSDFCKGFIQFVPEKSWKNIDYILAVQMVCTGLAGLAAVLLLPTHLWVISKFIIGPVFSIMGLVAMGFAVRSGITNPDPVLRTHLSYAGCDDGKAPRAEVITYRSKPPLIFSNWSGENKISNEKPQTLTDFTRTYEHERSPSLQPG